MNITANAPVYFRIRISTALLLIALSLLPFAAFWIPAPNIPEAPLYLHNFLAYFFYYLSPHLLLIALLAAFITAVVLALQRKWMSIIQCIMEVLLCFVTAGFFPVALSRLHEDG
ncbi:MAG: hypothetical protein ACU837_00780 [Gammaproteobacteria bacterium]